MRHAMWNRIHTFKDGDLSNASCWFAQCFSTLVSLQVVQLNQVSTRETSATSLEGCKETL